MGFGDKFKDLAKQAQEAVAEHKEQIAGAVDRASVVVDQRTGGKYADKIAKVSGKAGEVVEKLAGEQDVGGEPPVPGHESAPADAPAAGHAPAPESAAPGTEPPAAPPKPPAGTSDSPDFG